MIGSQCVWRSLLANIPLTLSHHEQKLLRGTVYILMLEKLIRSMWNTARKANSDLLEIVYQKLTSGVFVKYYFSGILSSIIIMWNHKTKWNYKNMLNYKTKGKCKNLSFFPIYIFDMENEKDFLNHYKEFLRNLVLENLF